MAERQRSMAERQRAMAERQSAMAERQKVKQSWSLGQRKVCPQSFGHALELFGQAEVCSGASGTTDRSRSRTAPGNKAERLRTNLERSPTTKIILLPVVRPESRYDSQMTFLWKSGCPIFGNLGRGVNFNWFWNH